MFLQTDIGLVYHVFQNNNCLSKYWRLLTDLWPLYHFNQEESRGHAKSWPVLPAHRTPDASLQPLHHDNVQCAFWGLYAAHSPSRLVLAEWKLSINKTHTNNLCVQPHGPFFSPPICWICALLSNLSQLFVLENAITHYVDHQQKFDLWNNLEACRYPCALFLCYP